MTLADFLRANDLTLSAVARTIEVSVESVSRYRDRERIPQPKIMARIKTATGGAVTADDFYPEQDQTVVSDAETAALAGSEAA